MPITPNIIEEDFLLDNGFSSIMLSGELDGTDVLGTFQHRSPNAGDGCQNIVGSANGLQDILVFDTSFIFTNTTGQTPVVVGPQPTLLGRTQDPSKAAAVSIGREKWLVAYANGVTEGISIKLATLNSSNEIEYIPFSNGVDAVDVDSLDIDTGDIASQVTIARSDDGTQIAVAAKTGCGASDLSISLLSFNATLNAMTNETSYSLILPADGTFKLKNRATKAFPSLMWRESPTQGWFLAYQEAAARAVVVMLDTKGAELGTGDIKLHSTGIGTHKSGSRLLRAENNGVALMSPIHNQNAPSTIQVSTLECKPQ
jgi:hypothetical protein